MEVRRFGDCEGRAGHLLSRQLRPSCLSASSSTADHQCGRVMVASVLNGHLFLVCRPARADEYGSGE